MKCPKCGQSGITKVSGYGIQGIQWWNCIHCQHKWTENKLHWSAHKYGKEPMTSCPDCKDGFYYPLFGPREKCRTCQGACHVIVIEVQPLNRVSHRRWTGTTPNVQNVSHEIVKPIFNIDAGIQRFLKRYANLSSSPGFRTVGVDSRQQEARQAEDRSEAVDVGPCGAD